MPRSQRDIMTVREMIDAAIVFENSNPIVDFKMLESIFFIMARHLNVLNRQMQVLIKSRKPTKPKKKLQITEIKIHTNGKKGRKSTKRKSGRSRSSRRYPHGTTSEDSDDGPYIKKRGRSRSRSKSRSHSKKRKRRFSSAGYDKKHTETDEDGAARSRARSKSKSRKAHRGRKRLAESNEDEDGGSRRRSKSGGGRRSRQRRTGPDEDTTRSGQRSKSKQPNADRDGTTQKRGKGQKGKNRKYKSSDKDDSSDFGRSSDAGIREKVLVAQEFKSAVTEDQFRTMVAKVRQLQEAFGVTDVIFGPKPQKIYLEKSTSLTDPRAALNMAARLEVAEKTLNDMLTVLKMYADKIGIDVDGMDNLFDLEEALLNESNSEQTSKTDASIGSRSPPRTQITGKMSVEPVIEEDDSIDEGDIVTWQQLTLGLTDFQAAFHRDLFNCVTEVANTATNAKAILQSIDPRMKEAQLLNSKFVKVQILTDKFVNNVSLLDRQLTMQMSACHEDMIQTQYDLDSMLERIEDICSHPIEDPAAVASTKDEFASMLLQINFARSNQNLLGNSHESCASDMKIYWKKIAIIQEIKTIREEVTEALKDKASISDLNGLLSIEEFSAVIGYLQQEILTTTEHIYAGEIVWQKIIHDLVVELHDKATHDQIDTLTNSINVVVRAMANYLEQMLHIVGPYPKNEYKKKLDNDGNCLSCGSPANVALSKEYMKVAEQMAAKSEKEKTKEKKPQQKPCIPGLPIPHPLDPRSLFCKRFCGASAGQHEINEKEFEIEILDIDPGHAVGIESQIKLPEFKIDLNLPCSPCNEDTIFYFK